MTPKAHKGKVYLVGAGPGDPKLLTLRGLECLRAAEVVVYDRLVSRTLLRLARPEARRIYVGKTPGESTFSQEQINRLLVEEASAGRVVCRLKGGDPFVFGRGGEEAQALVEADIPFEVVPGVTSAIAAPAYAGIPVTDRRYASSVCFITGQEDPEKEGTRLAWEQFATGPDTLVFLMGMKQLPEIVERLVQGGRPADTPAAVIEWGTTGKQRVLVDRLAGLAEAASAAGFGAPSVVVVGDVVLLREQLSWFELKPLAGRQVLVTRAREQASEMSARLAEYGAEVIEFPLIRIQPLAPSEDLRQLALCDYDWVIFTSANGVPCYLAQLAAVGLDARALGGARLAAIGPGTAAELERRGLRVEFVPARHTAEGLLEEFPEDPADLNILIPRAEQAREALPEGLQARGAEVTVVPVYRTVVDGGGREEVAAMLADGEIDVITFASSSTVRNFRAVLPEASLDGVIVACIGPVTAQTAEELGIHPDIVTPEMTIEALVEAVAEWGRK